MSVCARKRTRGASGFDEKVGPELGDRRLSVDLALEIAHMKKFSRTWTLLVALLAVAPAWSAGASVDADEANKGLLELSAHWKPVTAVVFSPDGKVLASAALDGLICFWDIKTAKRLGRFEAHKGGVYGLSYASNGKLLASAGADKVVRLWDPATSQQVREFKGHTDKVAAVAFSPDSKLVASSGYDSAIRLWNPETGEEVRQLVGHEKVVTALAFSADGKQLVSGGVKDDIIQFGGGKIGSVWSDNMRLWDVSSGKQVRKLECKGHSVAFASDGTIAGAGLQPVLTRLEDGTRLDGESVTSLVDAKSGYVFRTIKWRGDAVAVSPDSRTIATGHGCTLHFDKFGVMGAEPPEGRKLAEYRVCLWESLTCKQVFVCPTMRFPTQIAFSGDCRCVAAADADGFVFIWHLPVYILKKAAAKELDGLWKDLASDDSTLAYQSMWSLVKAGSTSVALTKCFAKTGTRGKTCQAIGRPTGGRSVSRT